MRTYGEFCAVAKALDVVGDRWTLLVVRELLLRGASRYTDLREGLPGIATNLLVARLRALEEAGIVVRQEAPPPVATTLFRLTPRGEELAPLLQALVRWGAPLMEKPSPKDEFRGHWLALPVSVYLKDLSPKEPPISIQVTTDDQPVVIEAARGAVRARLGVTAGANAELAGPPSLVLGVVAGRIRFADARKRGLRFKGDYAALRRLGIT